MPAAMIAASRGAQRPGRRVHAASGFRDAPAVPALAGEVGPWQSAFKSETAERAEQPFRVPPASYVHLAETSDDEPQPQQMVQINVPKVDRRLVCRPNRCRRRAILGFGSRAEREATARGTGFLAEWVRDGNPADPGAREDSRTSRLHRGVARPESGRRAAKATLAVWG